MMKSFILASILPTFAYADNYAVIAVGSSSYWNYRHQADGCHAYQIMRKSGIPEENIVFMMQDDVANSSSNPFKGQLFNKPGDDPVDVYAGCKVDYRGEIVTGKLFTSVITGDASGVPSGGKVLKSGPNDKVFLNFVDHGGVGLIAFPNGPPLHAKELSTALKQMQKNTMFKELVFYMEACESGSMFPGLTPDGKIFAVTAANAKESSWGFYCGAEAKVKGKNMNSCLGDLFSIAWMEDTDLGSSTTETFSEQVRRVTKRTNKSHVMTFGDKSFENEPIGNFEQTLRGSAGPLPPMIVSGGNEGAVDVRDVPLHQALFAWTHTVAEADKTDAWKQVQRVTNARKGDDAMFHDFVESACHDVNLYQCVEQYSNSRDTLNDMECHQRLVRTVHESCPRRESHLPGGWNDYNMKYSQVLVNLCEGKDMLGKDTEGLNQIIVHGCYVDSANEPLIVV